ncbi:MAG: hypothetical protein R3C14_39835 [Caldilineaceae bacterium]
MDSRNFFQVYGDWLAQRQGHHRWQAQNIDNEGRHVWLPQPGNVIFTLVIIGCLVWSQKSGALSLFAAPNAQSTSTGTIAYQGRLADVAGNPLTQTVNMTFRLYAAASGGAPLWEEQWTGSNSVQVSDGLFNVMLGSLTPIPQTVITGNSNLFLGITVGTDGEMNPRVQLGSAPFAIQALTVPDGSITAAKLASDISLEPPDGSITTAKLANGAVTSSKMAPLVKNIRNGGGNIWPHNGDWTDAPGVAIDFTSSEISTKSTLLIFYTQQFKNDAGQIVYARVVVDSQEVFTAQGAGSQWFMLTIPTAYEIGPGAHTVKVQYKPVLGGSAIASNYSLTAMVVGRQ